MTRASRGKTARKSRKNETMDVRVVPYWDPDGAKVERQIQSLKESQATTRVLLKTVTSIGVASAGAMGYINSNDLYGAVQFQALAAIFAEAKLVSMRYDVYDLQPGGTFGIFGTYVQNKDQNSGPVTDSPDAKIVPIGVGKAVFYWRAKDIQSNIFQSSMTAPPVQGGLKFFAAGGPAVANRWQVVTSFVVDFRGRE